MVIIVGPGHRDYGRQIAELRTLCEKSKLSVCFIGNGIDSLQPQSIATQIKDRLKPTSTILGLFHGSTIPNKEKPGEMQHMAELIGPWNNTPTTPSIDILAKSFPAAKADTMPQGKIKLFSCKVGAAIPKTLPEGVVLSTHAGTNDISWVNMSLASIKRTIEQESNAKEKGTVVDPFTSFADGIAHSPETATLMTMFGGKQISYTAYPSDHFIKEITAIKEDISKRIIPKFIDSLTPLSKASDFDPSLHSRITSIPDYLTNEQLIKYRSDATKVLKNLKNTSYIENALNQATNIDELLVNEGRTLFHRAAEQDGAKTLDLLLKRIPNGHNFVDINGNKPLHNAAGSAQKEYQIKALITAGADPNEKKYQRVGTHP